MSVIFPFRALRPSPQYAQDVASLPYDVMNRKEAQQLCEGAPWSLLHVTRSEVGLPAETDPYSETVYKKASEQLKKMIQNRILIQENEPHLYLYQLKMGQHLQIGVVGCFSVPEYQADLIKKHERTRREKEDDRTRHIRITAAQTGPVFLTYSHVNVIDAEVGYWKNREPIYHFIAADGIEHSVWKVNEPEKLVDLFKCQVRCLYIADGHHRAASASRVYAENPNTENGRFIAVAFPDNQLQILPYHRIVKDLNGLSETAFIEKVKERFLIQAGSQAIPPKGSVGMYLSGAWQFLTPKNAKMNELDVAMLQDEILCPLLGIQDPRTDKRIDFVGGIRGTSELERLVQSGEARIAFSMHPTEMSEVMEIADAGGIMPPKSTWFEPKLRDGLLIHLLE